MRTVPRTRSRGAVGPTSSARAELKLGAAKVCGWLRSKAERCRLTRLCAPCAPPVPVCLQRYPFVVVYNDAKWNLEKRFSDFAELDAALDTYFEKDEDTTVGLAQLSAVASSRARVRGTDNASRRFCVCRCAYTLHEPALFCASCTCFCVRVETARNRPADWRATQQLPEFPPKKYFGSLSPALIKERQEALEKYMKHLVQDKKVLQCKELRQFLETPDTTNPDKHKEYDFGRR